MFASRFGSFRANPESDRGAGTGSNEWNRQQHSTQRYGQPSQYEAVSSGSAQHTRTAIKDLAPHQPNTVRYLICVL